MFYHYIYWGRPDQWLLSNDGAPVPSFAGQHMYTDIENTGAPMVPEISRNDSDDRTDARRFREEMVLSHRLPDRYQE